MKRSERHRLKENEVALSVVRAREQFEEHRRTIIAIASVVVAVIVIVSGYFWWRQHNDAQSRAMLGDAMAIEQAPVAPPPAPPAPGQPAATANNQPAPGTFPTEEAKLNAALPKFLAAADSYPSTKAGVAARYHAATCLVGLGRSKEAIDQFKQVIDRAGDTIYADMGRMGLAEAQMQARQYDAAITEYRDLSTRKTLPTDGVLMQLGRAYAAAGRKAEAERTFQRIIDEFPQSQYAQVAKRELESSKSAGA